MTQTFTTIDDQPIEISIAANGASIRFLPEGVSKHSTLATPQAFPTLRDAINWHCARFGYDEEQGRSLDADDFVRSVELSTHPDNLREDGSPASSFNIQHDDAVIIVRELKRN